MKNNSEFNNGHILGTLFHTCICYMAERDVPLKSTNCQRYQQMTTNYCSFTCTIIDYQRTNYDWNLSTLWQTMSKEDQ